MWQKWSTYTAIYGLRSIDQSLNHVFALVSTDVAANRIVSRMLSSFEKSCPIVEVKPSEWNLFLILWNLTCLPNKLYSDKLLTWITCLLLALTLTKRISELHGLLYRVTHLRGWKTYRIFSVLAETSLTLPRTPQYTTLNLRNSQSFH